VMREAADRCGRIALHLRAGDLLGKLDKLHRLGFYQTIPPLPRPTRRLLGPGAPDQGAISSCCRANDMISRTAGAATSPPK
jgi:hypothetical protein